MRSEAKTFALCFLLEIGRRVQIWTENFGFGDRRFADWNYAPIEKFGVSDGTWTRNIRFGRPLLSHLSFAHEIYRKFGASGKIWTFESLKKWQFYRLLDLNRPATDAWKIIFGVKWKRQRFRQTSDAIMPRTSQQIFFFGTRQSFYRRRKSTQTLCLFSFLSESFPLAASSRTKTAKPSNYFRLFNCQTS